MDLPIKTKLELSFVSLALVGGLVTVIAGGSFLRCTLADDADVRLVLGVLLSAALVNVILALAMGAFMARRLTQRIAALTDAALALQHGELDARVPLPKHAQQDELKRLQVIFNEMAAALQRNDEELRRSQQQLRETAEELREWNESYLSTLAFITHELKNQIASTRLNLLALRDGYIGDLTPEQREALDDVMATVNRTEEMLLNYLNLSRIEKGELVVRERPVRIREETVEPVLRHLQPQIADRRMQVEVDIPDDLTAQADPTLLQTVYENLLTNAIKYGRAGGLIRVSGSRRNGMVELHVWNEGQGVAPDQIGQLFGKFSRLHPPGELERGTGLGLFIDREIVRLHGGDIRAESDFGHWIDFVFTLPRPDEMLETPVIT